MPIAPFGWVDNSAPAINAANLEAERASTGAYVDAQLGTKLTKTANLSDVVDPDTSRANLLVVNLRSAQCVSVANVVSLSGPLPTIDGYAVQDGDRVLLTGQTTTSQNGPWIAHATGWVRPNDFTGSVTSRSIDVVGGTVYGPSRWMLSTTGSVTVDTTAQTWVQPKANLPASAVTATASNLPSSTSGSGQIVNIPTFQPNQPYPDTFCIQVAGVLYARIGAGTSGATWAADAINWQPIAGTITRSEIAVGNMPAAYGPTIQTTETWISGTLTANTVITLTGLPAGGLVRFTLTQDIVGGRTVTISNGVSPQSVTVPLGAGATVAFDVYTPDGSNLYIQGPSQLVYQLSASNASWPVPPGANALEVTAWGGYGGGGGGGSCVTAIAQSPGAGGGLPVPVRQIIQVAGISTLNVTIGAGGTGGTGGAAGAANPGTAGGYGGDTTVTATGINVRSYGGGAGLGGAAGSTSITQTQYWGAKAMGGGSGTIAVQIGMGGLGSPTGGAGSPPFDFLNGGGGGGGAANATTVLGGGAGGNGGPNGSAGGGAQGASATVNGADAAANTTGGAGGGGGGGANGGRGGNGAPGGSGGVIFRVVG